MSSIQESILESFYRKLSELDEIQPEKIIKLRELLSSGQKVKADSLVAIFAQETEGDLNDPN